MDALSSFVGLNHGNLHPAQPCVCMLYYDDECSCNKWEKLRIYLILKLRDIDFVLHGSFSSTKYFHSTSFEKWHSVGEVQ